MKIIYITEQLYIHGGAEKILSQKLNYWADTFGYEVLLITSEQENNELCYPLSSKIKHVDLKIGYNKDISYFKKENLKRFPKHYKLLKNEIINFNPDAIFLISLSWIRFVLPLMAKKYAIYNEYHTSHYGFELGYKKASFLTKIKKKISNNLIKIVEKFYTNIIFLNQEEFDFYNKKNAVIIPNFFIEKDSNLNEVKKKNQIIALGRMSFQKGFDLLIDSWKKIDSKIDGWSLKIYGNGDDKEILKKKIAALTFKNDIEICDAISDVNPKLAESKFYVMSSRFETFPMVLMEALSHGLPIVSFDCPSGPRSIIIENEDGLLVEPGNVTEFSKKMLKLINDDELRKEMSVNAKKNIKRFNQEFVMNSWNELVIKNSKNL